MYRIDAGGTSPRSQLLGSDEDRRRCETRRAQEFKREEPGGEDVERGKPAPRNTSCVYADDR